MRASGWPSAPVGDAIAHGFRLHPPARCTALNSSSVVLSLDGLPTADAKSAHHRPGSKRMAAANGKHQLQVARLVVFPATLLGRAVSDPLAGRQTRAPCPKRRVASPEPPDLWLISNPPATGEPPLARAHRVGALLGHRDARDEYHAAMGGLPAGTTCVIAIRAQSGTVCGCGSREVIGWSGDKPGGGRPVRRRDGACRACICFTRASGTRYSFDRSLRLDARNLFNGWSIKGIILGEDGQKMSKSTGQRGQPG